MIRLDGVVNLHTQQAAHSRVHGGFPQLGGVHLSQAFVALACGGIFGLHNQPAHGLAEIRNLFFLGPFAVTAHDACAVGQQGLEGLSRLGQCRVVCAVYKVLGDDAAFHITVVATADAQNRFVGPHIKFAGHDSVWQMRLQGGRRCHGSVQRIQVQRHTIGQRAQGLGIHEAAQAGNHGLRELVLAR